MKFGEVLTAWAVGLPTSILTGGALFFTGRGLRVQRQKDEASREDRLRADRDTATNQASGYYRQIVDTLLVDVQNLRDRVDGLQKTVDDLRDENAQLRGEKRQLEAVIASHDRNIARSPAAVPGPVGEGFGLTTLPPRSKGEDL